MGRRPWLILVGLGIALAGWSCRPGPASLGLPVEGAPQPVARVRGLAAGEPAIVEGRMVEKCPVAGCWFVVQDATGTIKVDTKAAGFVVVDVPLQRTVTVSGRVEGEGAQRQLAATGLRCR